MKIKPKEKPEGIMILKSATITIIVALLVIAGCVEEGQLDKEKELAEVRRVIETSISWAKTKDTTALYDCFVQDSTLFFFNPNNAGNIISSSKPMTYS